MANVDAPRGLFPIRHMCGGEIRANSYLAAANQTIYRGDLLQMTSAGTVSVASASATKNIGVAAEYKSIASGSTSTWVSVFDDPYIVFGVQAASSTSAAATHVGNNADIAAGAGGALTKVSGHEIQLSTATANTAQLRVIGLMSAPGNAWGEHADLEVVINEHLYKATAGV